jgi:HTH-type transcriptional regulator, transcriptional repressor of NAD biosynthesis genes
VKPSHGLVIGKFYPPHAGHRLLVQTAAAVCRRVSVVVMAARWERIPLRERVAWLREDHALQANVQVAGVADDHPVDYHDDAVWRAHVALMLEGARSLTPDPVDAVFTSEAYGPELARRLGAVHVAVDPGRGLVPISGTEVRRDPAAAWEHLSAPVRAGIARRVVIVGAESTGKTTLAAELAEALRARGGSHGLTRWVPEYGREHTIRLLAEARARAALEGRPRPALEDLTWPSADFELIAARQNAAEEAAARAGGPVLVCDTDAFATGIWHERYVGHRSPAVEALGRAGALYLLTDPDDVPFTQDGLRDGQHLRRWMTGVFAARLAETGRTWRWLRGDRRSRLAAAVEGVGALLQAWRLDDP